MDDDPPGSRREPADGRDVTESADGGVVRRLARRTTVTLVVIVVLVAVIAVAVSRVVDVDGAGGPVVAAVILVLLGLIPVVVLARRISLWHQASDIVTRLSGDTGARLVAGRDWVTAACGEPVRVHRANSTLRRVDRLPPHYLPLRAESGVLGTGRTVLVHARHDGVTLRAGDRLELLALRPSRRGPFLVRRRDDGLIFVADGWLLSAA